MILLIIYFKKIQNNMYNILKLNYKKICNKKKCNQITVSLSQATQKAKTNNSFSTTIPGRRRLRRRFVLLLYYCLYVS